MVVVVLFVEVVVVFTKRAVKRKYFSSQKRYENRCYSIAFKTKMNRTCAGRRNLISLVSSKNNGKHDKS